MRSSTVKILMLLMTSFTACPTQQQQQQLEQPQQKKQQSKTLLNVAVHRPSYQSSTQRDGNQALVADLANDDRVSTTRSACAQTASLTLGKAWWSVDLGQPMVIHSVNITTIYTPDDGGNTGGIKQAATDTLMIGLSNEYPLTSTNYSRLCIERTNDTTSQAVSLICADILSPFRYVTVLSSAEATYLRLCDVQVLVHETPSVDGYNVGLRRPALQSSVYVDEFGAHSADLAVDGSRQTSLYVHRHSCMRTSSTDQYPWWVVDLGRKVAVDRVVVTLAAQYTPTGGATGPPTRLIVGLTDSHPLVSPPSPSSYTLCHRLTDEELVSGATVVAKCSDDIQSTFRYVVVQPATTSSVLSFCELEVYAKGVQQQEVTSEATPVCSSSNTSDSCGVTDEVAVPIDRGPFFNVTIALAVVLAVVVLLAIIIAIITCVTLRRRAAVKRQAETARQTLSYVNRSVERPVETTAPSVHSARDDDDTDSSCSEDDIRYFPSKPTSDFGSYRGTNGMTSLSNGGFVRDVSEYAVPEDLIGGGGSVNSKPSILAPGMPGSTSAISLL